MYVFYKLQHYRVLTFNILIIAKSYYYFYFTNYSLSFCLFIFLFYLLKRDFTLKEKIFPKNYVFIIQFLCTFIHIRKKLHLITSTNIFWKKNIILKYYFPDVLLNDTRSRNGSRYCYHKR